MAEQPPSNPEARNISEILKETRCVAVVGLSPDPARDSHKVADYLLRQGYQVVPVNPKEESILGQKCYACLSDIPHPVDLVDVFRASEHTPAIAREAASIGAKTLWLQLGVRNPEACRLAGEAGLNTVQDKCLKVEHHRLLGGRS